MQITKVMLESQLLNIFKKNSPVRKGTGPVGKQGTTMYSPYPGNLKNNGIYQTNTGIRLDLNKVGYILYANANSRRPQFIENSIEEFVRYCISLGGRRM